MYSAENLTMVGDVIVTLNYRIMSLGFLRTESEKYPGNFGLWDQQLALQWIHNNIVDFGGDPNRATIVGESAGEASFLYQSLYPGNRVYSKVLLPKVAVRCVHGHSSLTPSSMRKCWQTSWVVLIKI